MIKYILLSAFFLAAGKAGAQELTIPLVDRAEDAEYTKMMMVTNMFLFRNDSVANPIDLASARPEDPVNWKKVKSPVMNATRRLGFGWIFGGEYNDPFAPHHTLIVVENPGWTMFPTLIWTDRNHNYDLTDDGPPDTMTAKNGAMLKVDDRPNGFRLYVEHFPENRFQQFEMMHDNAMYKLQGSRRFMGTANSFRERRMNVLAGTWRNGADSFGIAIKDANCNGRYDDDGTDQVMVSDAGSRFENLQAVVLQDGRAYLEWDGVAYDIREVSAEGQFIRLIRDTSAQLKFSLNIGDKLPRFRYCTATKPPKRKGIRRLKGKYTYVYIWHDQSPRHLADSAGLHALGRLNQPDFQVLALNYGASGRYIYRYNKRFETNLLQGFSSNDLNRKLKVKKIPTGILIDKKQRIIAVGITPEEVRGWLQKKSGA